MGFLFIESTSPFFYLENQQHEKPTSQQKKIDGLSFGTVGIRWWK